MGPLQVKMLLVLPTKDEGAFPQGEGWPQSEWDGSGFLWFKSRPES